MRVHNFNAGPSALPLSALERAQSEMLDFQGTGMSIMEHSHRGKAYEAVHDETLGLLRTLLGVPDEFEILLLQGGASQQFAQVPMNLLHPGKIADYVLTGIWSEKALGEAQIVGQAHVAATTGQAGEHGTGYTRVPSVDEIKPTKDAAYLHITSNNTLFGTQYRQLPTSSAPLVVDMSSDFLSRPVDSFANIGLIYAGAQKNIGPSGVTVVIVRRDLVTSGRTDIPKFFQYRTHAKERSLSNTPPTFAIYLARYVLQWLRDLGGLPAIETINERKASLLYDALDELAAFYSAPVERASRSRMNVVFRCPTPALDDQFVKEATAANLVGLKGHRLTGGIRASLYNAVPVESVSALVSFVRDFARSHG